MNFGPSPHPEQYGSPRKAAGKHAGLSHREPVHTQRVLIPPTGYGLPGLPSDGSSRLAVTNVGTRPTVDDGDQVNVEGFLLDFSGDLYGKTIRMEFYKRLRRSGNSPLWEALREESHAQRGGDPCLFCRVWNAGGGDRKCAMERSTTERWAWRRYCC